MADPVVTGSIGAAVAGVLAAVVRQLEIHYRFNGGRNPVGTESNPIIVKLATAEHDALMEIRTETKNNSIALEALRRKADA